MPGMKWIEPISFEKVPETPFSAKYLATRGPKKESRNTKIYRGQETHPIRVDALHEMNWDNIFFKKFGKPHFRPNIWPPEDQKLGLEHANE